MMFVMWVFKGSVHNIGGSPFPHQELESDP